MSFMNAFLAIQAGSASGRRQDFMGESRAVQLEKSVRLYRRFPGGAPLTPPFTGLWSGAG